MAKLPEDPRQMERTVADIAAASFKNARALHSSAQAVLDGEQWPAAFSLAALALEEIGKAAMCMTMIGMPPAVREEFRSYFNKAFTDHQAKAFFAQLTLTMSAQEAPASVEQMLDDVVKTAGETNAMKFRGFYVDYDPVTGELLEPGGIVSEAQARWITTMVTTGLASMALAEAAVADDPYEYLDLVRQWQQGMDFDGLRARVDADPEGFLAEARAFARDEIAPPAYFVGTGLSAQLAAADARQELPAGERPQPTTS